MDEYKRLNYYQLDAEAVLQELRTSKNGLTRSEATERLEQLGPNKLHRLQKTWVGLVFLRQFKNLLVVILLISAAFSIYLHDAKTATILLLIALMNAVVGFLQEHKAETLMESLTHLVVPKAKALRDGRTEEIDSTELVLGDIVYIEEGDSVPADLRMLSEQELATNDFALTGESNPSRKFVHAISGAVPLPNRHNLVFMGTTVAIGNGLGIVVGTAMQTELGRIASLSQVAKTDNSPLQKEMSDLATKLVQGTLLLAVVLAGLALSVHWGFKTALLFAIGISSAMIPNGLVAEVNITLAQTAGRMARAKALVKKLSAVETLGATNIIATDKTGTLTKNEMTVEDLLIDGINYHVSGTGYEANGTVSTEQGKVLSKATLTKLQLFFATGAFASNAHIDQPDDEHADWYCVGDPTEGALITLARKADLDPDALRDSNIEHKEFQFDSGRKRMSSIRTFNGQLVVFVKGAPESVLARSSHVWKPGSAKAPKLTEGARKRLLDHNESQAAEAKRNLGFAYRVLPMGTRVSQLTIDQAETDLIFLGMVSMVDPLRNEVPAAMAAAHKAHIKVSIITGDFATTAKAIALKAGLAGPKQEVSIVTGEELRGLSDAQVLQLVIRGGAVFSRVAPEDKLRIVELVKQHGQVVAVTGDGINDAPALKRADIGVAMGRTGTDVAKEAAEIVLLDDSFGTLLGAVRQGRLTYQNIKKAARCVLTDNAAELLTVLLGLVGVIAFHIAPAITPIQILAIDVVAQILPITALGWDDPVANLMLEKPRNAKEHIVSGHTVQQFVGYGSLAAGLAYLNYLWFFSRRGLSAVHLSTHTPLYASATTLTYVTLILCLYVYLIFERSDSHEAFFTRYLWSNTKLLGAFLVSFILIINLAYNPWLQPYFSTGPLSLSDWLTALLAAGLYFAIRLFLRSTRHHSRTAVVALHRQLQQS